MYVGIKNGDSFKSRIVDSTWIYDNKQAERLSLTRKRSTYYNALPAMHQVAESLA